VLSSDGNEGSVYSLDPKGLDAAVTRIEAKPAGAHPDAALVMPVVWWANGEFKDQYDPARDEFRNLAEIFASEVALGAAREYASPDRSIVLPAFRVFHQGPANYLGWRFSHSLDTHGFTVAKPGTRLYFSSAGEAKTYAATVGSKGVLENLKPFVERGGESVVADAAGRVYVANGQIFVYSANGNEVGRIDVPERPLQILFGGANKQTLFILTHHSLYSVNVGQVGS